MLNVNTMLCVSVYTFYLNFCGGLLVLPDLVVRGVKKRSFISLEGLANFTRVPSANDLFFLAPVSALTADGSVSFTNFLNDGLRPTGCVLGLTDGSALVVRFTLFATNCLLPHPLGLLTLFPVSRPGTEVCRWPTGPVLGGLPRKDCDLPLTEVVLLPSNCGACVLQALAACCNKCRRGLTDAFPSAFEGF